MIRGNYQLTWDFVATRREAQSLYQDYVERRRNLSGSHWLLGTKSQIRCSNEEKQPPAPSESLKLQLIGNRTGKVHLVPPRKPRLGERIRGEQGPEAHHGTPHAPLLLHQVTERSGLQTSTSLIQHQAGAGYP